MRNNVWAYFYAAVIAVLVSVTPVRATEVGTFANPLMQGADPSIAYHDGHYYLVQSEGNIVVRKSPTLTGLPHAPKVVVWTPPSSGPLCCEIWAPEIFIFNSKAYIYFAADYGTNDTHRMYVIESVGGDPQGGYYPPKKVAAPSDQWAIDGTVLQKDNGALYFVWSGWPSNTNTLQSLYIAPMSNPTTISGERSVISEPLAAWERYALPVNEGPEVVKRNGKIHIVFSASASWTDEYCLGLLTMNATADPMLRSSWTKSSGCVFSKNTSGGAFGPGHNFLTRSPDGTEDWNIYHATSTSGGGWAARNIRAQKFTWNANGTPNFGTPVAINTPVAVPSGDRPPIRTIRLEAEAAALHNVGVLNEPTASDGKKVGYIDLANSFVQFSVVAPTAATYELRVRFGNGSGATSSHNVLINGGASTSISYPNTGWNRWSFAKLRVKLNAGANTVTFHKATNYAELDYLEYIEVPRRYEAESATVNSAVVLTEPTASGGRKVGYIDYADSYVEFGNVSVPNAGRHALTIRYGNGWGATSTHDLSVNGGASTPVTYISVDPNWNNRQSVAKNVTLNAGKNAIRLAKGSNYAELDYVEVVEVPYRYEAEAALLNRASIVYHPAASNERKVGYIDFADSYVQFTVNARAAGTHGLTIRYANGWGASSHNLSVNGGPVKTVSYENNGFENWTSAVVLVSLNAGSNTIRLSKGASYAELDYIELIRSVAKATTGCTVQGAILWKYSALGGASSFLRACTTSETAASDGIGRYNHFQGGSIYWTQNTGAWSIRGLIRDKWIVLGAEKSALGYPTSDEGVAVDGAGRFSHFQRGSIFWHPNTGAYEVRGAIRAKWSALGWERGFLGYPVTDETGTPDGVGRFNHFQGGSIYWTASTNAHEVHGAIRDKWASMGWEKSCLGYPTSDEYDWNGGKRSDFQRGSIQWTATGGAVPSCQ